MSHTRISSPAFRQEKGHACRHAVGAHHTPLRSSLEPRFHLFCSFVSLFRSGPRKRSSRRSKNVPACLYPYTRNDNGDIDEAPNRGADRVDGAVPHAAHSRLVPRRVARDPSPWRRDTGRARVRPPARPHARTHACTHNPLNFRRTLPRTRHRTFDHGPSNSPFAVFIDLGAGTRTSNGGDSSKRQANLISMKHFSHSRTVFVIDVTL